MKMLKEKKKRLIILRVRASTQFWIFISIKLKLQELSLCTPILPSTVRNLPPRQPQTL